MIKASRLALALLAAPITVVLPLARPTIARPADDVGPAMQELKAKLAALGTPRVEGSEKLGLTPVPVLYFGQTKMNNNFAIVDEVQKDRGGTATIFAKGGDDYYRVATNVKNADGTRAVGTVLDPQGKAIAALAKGESFTGIVDVLGKPYTTRYEPIRDAAEHVVGALYVGYLNEEQHAAQ